MSIAEDTPPRHKMPRCRYHWAEVEKRRGGSEGGSCLLLQPPRTFERASTRSKGNKPRFPKVLCRVVCPIINTKSQPGPRLLRSADQYVQSGFKAALRCRAKGWIETSGTSKAFGNSEESPFPHGFEQRRPLVGCASIWSLAILTNGCVTFAAAVKDGKSRPLAGLFSQFTRWMEVTA